MVLQEMCFARFNSVLTSLPPLPFHSLSTPSPLLLPGCANTTTRPLLWAHCCEALARGLCNCNMQCAVPLSLLFSFLAPPAMLRTDCLLLCTQRGAGAQPRQQDVRASSNWSLESKSSAFSFSSSPPLLILCSLLLCAVSHSMDAMSMPCHLLQVCVQGAGVGQEREPSVAFPPQIRFSTH